MIVMNSPILTCRRASSSPNSAPRGRRYSGSMPREMMSALLNLHIAWKVEMVPPSPPLVPLLSPVDMSVSRTQWGTLGKKSPIGLLHVVLLVSKSISDVRREMSSITAGDGMKSLRRLGMARKRKCGGM